MNLPLLEAHPTCELCELHTVAKNVGIATIWLEDSLPPGPSTPAVLFLGINPGTHEDEQGLPFVGKSGIWLRGGYVNDRGWACSPSDPGATYCQGAYIDGIGLRSRASIYIGNSVRCWTSANSKPAWAKHVKPCFPYLLADLLNICETHAASTVYVCTLGGLPTEVFNALVLGGSRLSLSDSFRQNGKSHDLWFVTGPSSCICFLNEEEARKAAQENPRLLQGKKGSSRSRRPRGLPETQGPQVVLGGEERRIREAKQPAGDQSETVSLHAPDHLPWSEGDAHRSPESQTFGQSPKESSGVEPCRQHPTAERSTAEQQVRNPGCISLEDSRSIGEAQAVLGSSDERARSRSLQTAQDESGGSSISKSVRGPFRIVGLSSFHPAAVDRDPNLIQPVSGHMQLLLNAIEGRTPTPSNPVLVPVRYPHTT